MHINTVKVGDIWVSYDIENVKTTDSKGKKEESVQIVAKFTQNGEQFFKLYNVSDRTITGAEMVSKLLDKDYAMNFTLSTIERFKISKCSPFNRI